MVSETVRGTGSPERPVPGKLRRRMKNRSRHQSAVREPEKTVLLINTG